MDVAAWLRDKMKMSHVADAAISEEVDGVTAKEMDKPEWKELGASGVQAAKIVGRLKLLMVGNKQT